MASKFSNEEARAILERSRALLDDDSRPIAEPEPTREEILQAELARPVETHNERVRREIGEREARQARRETTTEQAMAALEARLDTKYGRLITDQREFVFEIVAEAFKAYDEQVVEHICEPYEKKFRELTAAIDTLHTQLKQRGVEPVDLPALELRGHIQ